jgi:hypothetical protein
MKRKAVLLYAISLIAISVSMSCADKSRKTEIEQRKEALIHKQDSALAEAQQRLALVDSMLEATKAEHDQQHEWVMANSTKLKDNSPEVLRLNQLRARRDSLQVEWETLGAKIKYIRKKQNKE